MVPIQGKRQPTARTVTGDQCPCGPATRPGKRSSPHTPSLAGGTTGDKQRGGFGGSSASDAEAPNVQLDSGSRAAAKTPAERHWHVTRCQRAIRTASGRRVGAHLHVQSGGCARCSPCARRSPRLQTGASHLAGSLLQLTVRTAVTLDPPEVRSPPDQSPPRSSRHGR